MSKMINSLGKGMPGEEDVCVVCFREAEIFSIGECDHPVCFECSTRMRVLCGRTECPICRKDMAMVVFTKKKLQFSIIQYRAMKCEPRYSIYFEDDRIMKAYDTLLEHTCSLCEQQHKFYNFNVLKEHMRKVHEKFYCDLCVDNLKIFTHERRCYSRMLLAQHRRIGDTDDKSHRGHPLCEFCDSRYMDNDELFRHLRRDHFFCHFCDADGQHHYYEDYEALGDHFRKDHFLCEEGNCREERFMPAFRSKIDLQAHTAQVHGHGMSKSEARQARTVDIAFTVNHHQSQLPERGRGGRRGEGRGGRRQPQDYEEMSSLTGAAPLQMVSRQQAININCVQDFPSLGGKNNGVGEGDALVRKKSIAHKLAQHNQFTIRTSRGHHLSEEEFPSLGSTTSVSVTSAPSSISSSNAAIPTTSVHLSLNTKKANNQFDKPHGKSSGPNVSIQYNCTNLSSSQSKSFGATGKGKLSKPCIGSVSHSGNITVKGSGRVGARPKLTVMEEDFPSLQPPSKSYQSQVQTMNTAWVPTPAPVNTSSIVTVKGPEKAPSFPTTNSKPVNTNLFESTDFPLLAPCTESQLEKLDYSGRSSLTISMKKVPQNENKTQENDENSSGGKGKKKKKGNMTAKLDSSEVNKNFQNGPSSRSSKRKPLTSNNVYDDIEDPDGPVEDFTRGKLGEYEAIVSVMPSNIKLVTDNDRPNNKATKKSELQIGNLKLPEFSSEEFPSLDLGRSKGSNKTVKHPSASQENISYSTANSWNTSQPSKKRPTTPPGFSSKTHTGVLPGFTNTDMTFTSSLGQKFTISSTSEEHALKKALPSQEQINNQSKPVFTLPPNFDLRNKMLIDAIKAVFEGNAEKFNKFKHLAEIFRSGEIKGQEYYDKCRQIMGKKIFHSIFSELLALLPDIEKQKAVLEAYRKVDEGRGCSACFAICAVCQQVLISDDFSSHMKSHEFPPDEFPSLQTPQTSWQRRK